MAGERQLGRGRTLGADNSPSCTPDGCTRTATCCPTQSLYTTLPLARTSHARSWSLSRRGLANPVGMFLSLALLFRHLSWEPEAATLEAAVGEALQAGFRTRDLGGTHSTTEMGQAVRSRLPT